MPLPGWILPAVGTGLNFLSNILGNKSQQRANEANMRFAEKMYARSRKDSLADWNMQNEYNSPRAMMQRFQDAGLNPNLIYGEGITATAGVPRSPAVESARQEAFHPDFGGATSSLMSYYDVKLKDAQADNVAAVTEVQRQDVLLKAAETAKIITDTSRGKFELGQAKALSEYVLEAARMNLEKTAADIDRTNAESDLSRMSFDEKIANIGAIRAGTRVRLDENERAVAMQQSTIRKMAEEVLTLRLNRAKTDDERAILKRQLSILLSDDQLKQLDVKLRNMDVNLRSSSGSMPHDSYIWRVVESVIQKTRKAAGIKQTPMKR